MKNAILISTNNFDEARKKIRKNEGEEIIFSGTSDELNRKVLEKEKIRILLINQQGRKDRLKQRNSGLNSVLAKMAGRKGIIIGINLDELINSSKKNKSEILARVRQNIRLCIKNKLRMKFIAVDKGNERDIYDLTALGLVLGMPTWMVKSL